MKNILNRYGYHSEMNYIVVSMIEYKNRLGFYNSGRISYPNKKYSSDIGVWKLTKKII